MLNKLRKLQNKKGFTLVELIVVIAIIAILTAVIIPLVGRYSAQATYTTLQDAATNVSSSANIAVGDATQMGSVTSATYLRGKKDASGLKVVSDKCAGGATATAQYTAVENTDATGHKGTLSSIDDVELKICAVLADELYATLPASCSFYIGLKGNAVTGVVYATDSKYTVEIDKMTSDPTPSTDFKADTSFEKAYKSASQDVAIGLSGKFIPTSTT